jgi:hypothetical protein
VVILCHAARDQHDTTKSAVHCPLATRSTRLYALRVPGRQCRPMRLTMIFRIGGQPSRTVFHTVRFLEQLGAPCEQRHRARSPSCELLRGPSLRRARVKLRRVAVYPQLSALRLYKPGVVPCWSAGSPPLAQPVFGTAEHIHLRQKWRGPEGVQRNPGALVLCDSVRHRRT